jgi:mevalonate pyrophosphate decarboxylase
MDRNRFNAEVRPELTEIPIGEQGVAFDRLDLDAWVDEYKSRNGRPGQPKGAKTWDAKDRPVSTSAMGSGTSTSKSEAAAFVRALAQVASKKRKRI